MNLSLKNSLILGCLVTSNLSCLNSTIAQQEPGITTNSESAFSIELDAAMCEEESKFKCEFTETIDSNKGTRMIVSNNIPNHSIGSFPNSGNPKLDQLFVDLDENKDDRISKNEVRGPLQNDFDRLDQNNDGYLTRDELSSTPPPPNGRPE